jgi:hypothetical protein
MQRNSVTLSAGLGALALAALVLSPASADIAPKEHEAAIKACSTVNPTQPVDFVTAVDDGSGIGFSLVWLNDAEGNLWLCDADAEGNVYSYSLITTDLLKGAGPELIGLQLAADGGFEGEPQAIAEKVCAAYPEGGGTAMVSAPDGFEIDPGFVVFVTDSKGVLHLCNATSDAAVWAFESIGDPLSFEGEEPKVS